MKAPITTLARFAAAVALSAVALLPHTGTSHAASDRPLLKSDFYSLSEWMTYETGTSVPPIAGTSYARGLGCTGDFACAASFNMTRYPGYGLFSAVVGVSDAYHYYHTEQNCSLRLTVTADGKTLYKHLFRQGRLGVRIVVPLGTAQVVNLETAAPPIGHPCGFLIANPALLPAAPAPANPAPAGTSPSAIGLQLFSARVTAGGQETALITTARNASVMLVIDYPDGTQIGVGPKQAGADGHLAYTWTVQGGIHGTVHVTADSAGSVAQAAFQVG